MGRAWRRIAKICVAECVVDRKAVLEGMNGQSEAGAFRWVSETAACHLKPLEERTIGSCSDPGTIQVQVRRTP